MKIVFDIPHILPNPQSSEESRYVQGQLNTCVKRIASGSAKTWRTPKVYKGPGKTQVTFDLPALFHAQSNARDNAVALQALLHCLTAIDFAYLTIRPNTPQLYNSGVYYDRTNVWDSIPALYARGHGDCKSLSAVRVAELRAVGIMANATFRFLPQQMSPDGQTKYHILVARSEGYEDPSRVLGMGNDELKHFFQQTGT